MNQRQIAVRVDSVLLTETVGAPDEITLWRPVGPVELRLIAETGYRAFSPRLPEQPIFYRLLDKGYAIQIARDWNVKADGAGFVTRFSVDRVFLDRYAVRQVGGREHRNTGSSQKTSTAPTRPSSIKSKSWRNLGEIGS